MAKKKLFADFCFVGLGLKSAITQFSLTGYAAILMEALHDGETPNEP